MNQNFWQVSIRDSRTYMLKHFRSRPKLIKQTAWEFEFEPCTYGGATRMRLSGPDHCKEVLRNCEPVMVERRDGSPCKLGPGEGFEGIG